MNLERIEREKEQAQAKRNLENALVEERNLLLAQRHEMLLQVSKINIILYYIFLKKN